LPDADTPPVKGMRRIKGPGGLQKVSGSFGSVGPADRNVAFVFLAPLHSHQPRVTADLAVLHKTAMDVRLDEDLHLFAAIGAGYKFVGHVR
jgi:hypothetical protein